MRSEEEIGEMVNTLLNIMGDSSVVPKASAKEKCGHYIDCLNWVTEQLDTEDIIRGLRRDRDKGGETSG